MAIMTTEYFKKYIKESIDKVDKTSKLRHKNVVASTTLARENLERRLEGMNEFRQTLKDVNSTFITRTEYQAQLDKLIEDVKLLREAKANLEGKASMGSVYVSYVIAIIALVISIIRIFM